MNEEQLVTEINRVKEYIHVEETLSKNRTKPFYDELNDLTNQYSKSCSPLTIGDQIEYKPNERTSPGIVEILKANCVHIPDQWEYKIKVLSVGEGHEKNAVGNILWVKINRSETPQKLN